MDVSQEYIKMCLKATEIQDLADKYCDEFSLACWYAPNHVRCRGHFEDWHMKYKYCPVCRRKLEITPEHSICRRLNGDRNIWLPRQDQLQEMIDGTSYEQLAKLRDFILRLPLGIDFLKWEQLWLAFVMYRKFKKKWNGTDWIS